MKKRAPFQFIFVITASFFLGFLSCGRTPHIPDHLDDAIPPRLSEGLYRMKDLVMILDEEATKLPKDSGSDQQTLSDHELLLSSKKNLYEANAQANIFSLEKLLKIHTVEKGKKTKVSSGANIFIDPEISFLNEYELLDYTIVKPKTAQQKILKRLLGKIEDFKGFPNTDYYILPHFVGNYLILYKLGSPDKIPYNELPLARRIGDMLAVPFVGYSVEYCEAVKILNSNNKETLQSRPLCKGVPPNKTVKYIRLWEHNKQVFEYLQKLNFFQREFFKGQWFHFRTDLRLPSNRSITLEHPSFKPARLVKFHPSLGKMDVVEVNDLKQDDEKRALFIPVKWTDYEIARDSENLNRSFSERLKEDTHAIHRPYLEIKFNELVNNEFKYGGTGGKTLKSVVITKDYISFDIEITAQGRAAYLMRYAFKRYVENPDYIEKQWFKKDRVLFFPLSSVKRKYYEDPADHTQADQDRFKRVTRFDPQSREILWYFSKQSSQLKWIRDLGYEAVGLLNTVFKEAEKDSGYKIKVTLDRTGADKEVGDIRYNILNLVLSEGEKFEHFRLGSNIANPITGEIISTTANVWVNRIFSEYISTVRRYIRFHVYPPAWKMNPFSEDVMTLIQGNVETKNLQCGRLPGEPLGVTPFLHEKIQTVCKEVTSFIDSKRGKEVFHPKKSFLNDDDIIHSCVQKLARERILHAILHSMLHSLGLKDMPSASADRENFYKADEIKKRFGKSISEMATPSHPDPPQYSSVMDYVDVEYPILPVPGKLDITVLRFLYFDRVELKEGRGKDGKDVLKVPSGADKDPENPQKDILEAIISQGYSKDDLKDYKNCEWSTEHPLFCGQKDYGVSPLETVVNGICKVHNDTMSKRNRYDGKEIEGEGNLPDSIKAHYKKWKEYRTHILASQGKSILDYSFLNPDHIKEYDQVMSNVKDLPDIKPYYLIRQPIFDYLKRAAFVPAKHCIYKQGLYRRGRFHYKAVALESIEEKILRQYSENSEKDNEVFINCSSPVVTAWAEENKQGELVTEVGFFVKNRRYLIRPNEKTDSLDEQTVLQHALNSLFVTPISTGQSSLSFYTLQEPEFGAEYYREWLAYATEGVDLNPYIDRSAIKDPEIARDIQLKRVLSYNVDTLQSREDDIAWDFRLPENLWSFRQRPLDKYVEKLQMDYSNIGNKLLPLYFSYQEFSLEDLRDYADSIPANPGLHDSEIPFLVQAYGEYEDKLKKQQLQKDTSFAAFMKTHPAVLYNPDNSMFLLPYTDEKINAMSRLFRRYNEFVKCVEKQKTNAEPCDEIEDKNAFIKLMLDTYQ